MELRHLRSFVAAAEHESFTQAARALELTQAGISQHIAALERDLGTLLFDRKGRRVALTPAGRRLYEYARRILQLVHEAREQFGQAEPVRGTLRIAVSTVPAQCLLPELLGSFRQKYPQVQEAVSISDSAAATRAVLDGQADVGLVGQLPRSRRLRAEPIASDELVLVVPPGHALAQKKTVRLDDLRGEPLIVRELGSGSRRCVEQALEASGLPPQQLRIAVEVNSNEAICSAVQRGIGVAFLSESSIGEAVAAGRLVALRIRGLRLRRQLYVITPRDRPATEPLNAFLDFLSARKRK